MRKKNKTSVKSKINKKILRGIIFKQKSKDNVVENLPGKPAEQKLLDFVAR